MEKEEEEGDPMDVSVPALIELRVPSVDTDRGNQGVRCKHNTVAVNYTIGISE